jgi:hypothetical protein
MKNNKHPLLVGLIAICLSGLTLSDIIATVSEKQTITIVELTFMVINVLFIICGIILLLQRKSREDEVSN